MVNLKTYTAEQVAELLNVSVAWVYRQCREGEISHHRMGRSFRFTESDLQSYYERPYIPPARPVPAFMPIAEDELIPSREAARRDRARKAAIDARRPPSR